MPVKHLPLSLFFVILNKYVIKFGNIKKGNYLCPLESEIDSYENKKTIPTVCFRFFPIYYLS